MQKIKISRVIVLLLCVVILGFTASTKTAAQAKKYKFDVIVHDGTTPFYTPVINGMNIACAQINADCKFLGPSTGSDVPAEVDLIENAINSGVNAVIIDIPDEKAMEKVVAEAEAKNVGVYFIGTSYPKETQYGSIGQSFYHAGTVVGNQVIKYIPDGGKIAILISDPGNIYLEQRVQGIADTVKATGKFTVVGPVDGSTDETKSYSAIDATFSANPDLKGIFGVDGTTEVIARFIQKNNLKGKVMGGGFDLVAATVNAIKSGDMQFTVGQNPFLWGYLSVQQMYLQLEYGVRPTSIDSGADVFDASNTANIDPKFH